MSTRARGRVLVAVATMVAVWMLLVASARAGTYDVQVCTDFGEGPGAFVGSSTGAGFQTAPECGVNNGGFEAFEIDATGSVLRGYGGNWAATAPSPLEIVGALTRANGVRVDCTLANDGFSAKFFWGTGSNSFNQNIDYQGAGCTNGMGVANGINRSMAPAHYFGWRVGCTLKSSCLRGLCGPSCAGQGRAAAGAGEHRAACGPGFRERVVSAGLGARELACQRRRGRRVRGVCHLDRGRRWVARTTIYRAGA